ncbi:MAG: secondary thiamine-phosphate synthase enzyme YjbQ [Alphaproteobacteria bacterium]|nr:secondary thiamine-phosphate synthase enzyme YjbQ [Alphaproteobacteria bacterium]
MKNESKEISVATRGPRLYEISDEARHFVRECGVTSGLLTAYCRHTSASLIIQENADPDVQTDLQSFFARLVPEGDRLFRHISEGPDDMPAHVKSALTTTSISIPIVDAKPVFGTWQGLFLFEHRNAAHTRRIVLHIMGT